MKRTGIVTTIAGFLMVVLSMSSCVYHSRGPAYDNGYGYGYGYRHRVPPPRRVVVVPAPRPRVERDRGNARRYNGRSNRNYNRQSYRQYGHNGRAGQRR